MVHGDFYEFDGRIIIDEIPDYRNFNPISRIILYLAFSVNLFFAKFIRTRVQNKKVKNTSDVSIFSSRTMPRF